MQKTQGLPIYIIAVFTLFLFFISCDNDLVSKETKKINQFIKNCFDDVYLWNEKLPKININNESDPYVLFNKLKYVDDRWSRLIEDVKGFNSNVAGSGLSFGYGLGFYYKENSNEIIAVVRYIHPSTPADIKGLKRGDIILQINGQNITDDNYMDLYNTSSITLGMGEYNNGNFTLSDRTIQMNAANIYLEPIILYKIIEESGHKIGYMHYTDYLLKSHQQLSDVFTYFKNNGVNDIVLDLRYNSGGYAITSQYLCSMLVPEQVLNNSEVYLKEVWNTCYTNYYSNQNKNTTKYFQKRFGYVDEDNIQHTDEIVVNMDLSRVYILTSKSTASASEATIVGLMPYMNIIIIGESTSGKYCGGIVQTPADYNMKDKNIQNWGAYVMVYRYENNQNYPDHTNGLEPDIYMKENLLESPFALGDVNEPLLAQAIHEITGISPVYNEPRRINIDYRSAFVLENKFINEKMIDFK